MILGRFIQKRVTRLNVHKVWIICFKLSAPRVTCRSKLVQAFINIELLIIDGRAMEEEYTPGVGDGNDKSVGVPEVRFVVNDAMYLRLVA